MGERDGAIGYCKLHVRRTFRARRACHALCAVPFARAARSAPRVTREALRARRARVARAPLLILANRGGDGYLAFFLKPKGGARVVRKE